jgi:hypothetical protein
MMELENNNLERQELILDEISKIFTITKKTFGDGYFIFTFAPNYVCHFELKETPNWKYGIWLNENNGYDIFGEHVELIDKFKPSRTYISFENDISAFIELVKNISQNPKLYFVDSLTDGDALVAYKKIDWGNGNISYEGYQHIREYNEDTKLYDKFSQDTSITQEQFVEIKFNEYIKNKEQKKSNEEFDRVYAFDFFKSLMNIFPEIIAIGICDNNKNGWKSNPRYNILAVADANVSDEKYDELFEKLDDLITEKNCSKERITREHRFSFQGLHDELSYIKDCDYKYNKIERIDNDAN